MATSPVLFVYYPPLNDDSWPGVPGRHITEADWAAFTIAQRRTVENATTQEGYTRRKVWVHRDLVDETEEERAQREAAEAAARAEYDRKNSLVRYGQIESMIEQLEVLPPAEEFAALRQDVDAVADVPPRVEAVEADVALLRTDIRNVPLGVNLVSSVTAPGIYQLEAGVYEVPGSWTMPTGDVTLLGRGPGRTIIRAAAGTSDQNTVYAYQKHNIVLRDLTIDGNHANRAAALDAAYASNPANGRVVALHLSECQNVYLENVTVTGARGNGAPSGGSGVGCAITGSYARVINCIAIDNGIAGKASDGFFLAGTRMVIEGSIAENCLDHGFVLERANWSTIADCIAINCSDAVGISTAAAECRGNSIRGLTVYNWNASNTGGIQILTAGAGSIRDTHLSNIIMVQDDPSYVGSAIVMRETGTGRIDGISISDVSITGAGRFGIEVNALNVTIQDAVIRDVNRSGSGGGCIRVAGASRNVRIRGGSFTPVHPVVAAVGVLDGAANVSVEGCAIDCTGGTNWGVYFYGTVTGANALWNEITGTATGYVGSDAATTPRVLWRDNTVLASGILFGKERDTNLFRGGANVLQTDDTFAAPSVAVGSVAVPSRAAIYSGSGSPEGVVTARLGSIYLNIAGGAGASLWVKESGQGLSTGWVAK